MNDDNNPLSMDNMTMRDYFAAKIMGAILNKDLHITDQLNNEDEENTYEYANPIQIAATAYCYADAMLAQREKL